jgi:hypothetical protein
VSPFGQENAQLQKSQNNGGNAYVRDSQTQGNRTNPKTNGRKSYAGKPNGRRSDLEPAQVQTNGDGRRNQAYNGSNRDG